MERVEVKRLLALLKAEVELGRDPGVEIPVGFRESFESQEAFRGWINYHVTWDVDDDDVWLAVPLQESLVDSWHRELNERLPVITRAGEIVSPQQFKEMRAAGVERLCELADPEE